MCNQSHIDDATYREAFDCLIATLPYLSARGTSTTTIQTQLDALQLYKRKITCTLEQLTNQEPFPNAINRFSVYRRNERRTEEEEAAEVRRWIEAASEMGYSAKEVWYQGPDSGGWHVEVTIKKTTFWW